MSVTFTKDIMRRARVRVASWPVAARSGMSLYPRWQVRGNDPGEARARLRRRMAASNAAKSKRWDGTLLGLSLSAAIRRRGKREEHRAIARACDVSVVESKHVLYQVKRTNGDRQQQLQRMHVPHRVGSRSRNRAMRSSVCVKVPRNTGGISVWSGSCPARGWAKRKAAMHAR